MKTTLQDLKQNSGLLSAIAYVAFTLISNIVSTKLVLVPLLNMATDGGTIIYPLTFTLRDMLHKSYGKRVARVVVIFAGLMNAVMVLFLWLVHLLPADSSWALGDAYQSILLQSSRIVIASITAQIISELIDTEIFSKLYKFGEIKAVAASNFIALIVDSIVFSVIAFYGALPFSVVMQIIFTNIIIKLILAIGSSPAILLNKQKTNSNDI